MPNGIDLMGKKFSLLTVVEFSHSGKNGRVWRCKCDCGNDVFTAGSYLMDGTTKSCGCSYINPSTRHLLCNHRLYSIWRSMKSRCSNPNVPQYHNYGGRGISVCPSWESDFMNFYNDMIATYKDGLQLDRIDNNGNYEPSNCRWATVKEQMRNKNNNRRFEKDGISMVVLDWASFFGVQRHTITNMIKTGKTFDEVYDYLMQRK